MLCTEHARYVYGAHFGGMGILGFWHRVVTEANGHPWGLAMIKISEDEVDRYRVWETLALRLEYSRALLEC